MKLDGAALRLLCVAALFSGCMGQDSLQSRVRVTRVVDCVGGSDHQSCGFEAPCGTIQFALDKSLNGDRIEVMAGVCRGKGNFDLQFHGLGVELVGRASVEISGPAVQITCEGNGRAFKFQNSEDLRSTITGFVVRDCHADYGGAVWCSNSSPLFEHVVFRNNKASLAGGAIYWLTRGPVLRNCLFENNEAGAYGPDQASEFHTVHIPGGLPLLLHCIPYGPQQASEFHTLHIPSGDVLGIIHGVCIYSLCMYTYTFTLYTFQDFRCWITHQATLFPRLGCTRKCSTVTAS